MGADRKIRVLIVDDSAMVRRILSKGLSSDPMIEIIGSAVDGDMALQFLQTETPDVITLDLEMPRTDGLTFLRRLMAQRPIPTVVISVQTHRSAKSTVDALAAGAVDVIAKPAMELGGGLAVMMNDITERVKAAAAIGVDQLAYTPKPEPAPSTAPRNRDKASNDWMIAIGASTGGVQALELILSQLPADMPPIVIVQHMPEGFTESFAHRLDQKSSLQVSEAQEGDVLTPGKALIAPGGKRHMMVRIGAKRQFEVDLIEGPDVSFARPAVDVLFNSVAEVTKGRASAALLTGMGKDGAEGLLKIRKSGGRTAAQDENSSVVFGMPLAAQELGAPEEMVPLGDMPEWLMNSCPLGSVRDSLASYKV